MSKVERTEEAKAFDHGFERGYVEGFAEGRRFPSSSTTELEDDKHLLKEFAIALATWFGGDCKEAFEEATAWLGEYKRRCAEMDKAAKEESR